MMGDEIQMASPPVFKVEVIGTAPLEKVEIIRGTETIYRHPILDYKNTMPGRLRLAWSGARVKGRMRHTVWDGGLTLTGGRLLSATPFAFEHPKFGITGQTPNSLQWHSHTVGDRDGVFIDFEGDPEIKIDAGPAHFSFRTSEINAPRSWDLGGVEQRFEVTPVPSATGPKSTTFVWQDDAPMQGVHPYYLRVTQADDEMAWASPIFVELVR
jgi:hypothetical protein